VVLSSLPIPPRPNQSYQVYIAIINERFGTEAERAVEGAIYKFTEAIPSEKCLLQYYFGAGKCRDFRSIQNLEDIESPFIVVSENNLFSNEPIEQKAIVKLAQLSNTDEIIKVIAGISRAVSGDEPVSKIGHGETLRAIERTLGKYGKQVKDAFTLFGL